MRKKEELAPPRPLDPLTGERTKLPCMPAPDVTANELRRQRRAPALPKLARDGAAVRADKASLRLARKAARAELSYEPEPGLLEAVARAVAHVEERRVRIPEAEIRAVALGHAPGRHTLAEVDAYSGRSGPVSMDPWQNPRTAGPDPPRRLSSPAAGRLPAGQGIPCGHR